MTTMPEARSAVMARLACCPVCAAPIVSAEKSDVLETVTFYCGGAFYLTPGATIGVSHVCPAPSHVATRAMEREAEELRASEPHPYCPSVEHMGDCSVCGNVQDHPSHLGKVAS